MNKRTEEFLEKFKDFDNNDIKVIFGDIFSEFIEILNNADLSENTLIHLNGIFEKDMFLFFVETSKNYISKEKIKEKIKELKDIESDENINGSDLSIEEFNKEVINILKEFI